MSSEGGFRGGRGRASDYEPPRYQQDPSWEPKETTIEGLPPARPKLGEFNHANLGPLCDPTKYGATQTMPAAGFAGFKYREAALDKDTVVYRAAKPGQEWGDWFSETPPQIGPKVHRSAREGGESPRQVAYS